MQSAGKNIKVWRVSPQSTAGIQITDNKINLVSDKQSFISVVPGGVSVNGNKFSIMTAPENISKGGMFAENMGPLQMIPSTIATCIPNCLISLPGAGLIGPLMKGIGCIVAARA